MNMKEAAMAYEDKKTLNISDLDQVPIDVPLETKKVKEGTPEEFEVTVALFEGEEYRVPRSVLKAVKALLADPRTKGMTHFSVLRTGTTKDDTRYQVVPMGVKA